MQIFINYFYLIFSLKLERSNNENIESKNLRSNVSTV